MLFIKSKSKSRKVLDKLQNAGDRGVTNWELNKIMFRYGSVIFGLRKEGYLIRTVLVKRGLYKYYYEGKK